MADVPKSLKVDVESDEKNRYSKETQESLDKLVMALNQGYESPSSDNTKAIIEAKSELTANVRDDYVAYEDQPIEPNIASKVVSDKLSERAKDKVVNKAKKSNKSPAKGSWAEKALNNDNQGSGISQSF